MMNHQALLKQFEHLNHMNPDTFEVDDLDRLIKSVQLEREQLLNTVRYICQPPTHTHDRHTHDRHTHH